MTPPAAQAIPAFDCVAQFESLRDEILAAVEGVLAAGSLVLGPRVRAFERQFTEFLGEDGESVGVGNGTDALSLALRALGVGAGDEVITVANTAVPTVSAIRAAGALPVFCDVEPGTLLMDVDAAARRITSRTKAIVPVHLFGGAVDMDRLLGLARERGLAVVEDCAQACGTTYRGQMVGTLGDVGCFSFYPTKNLGAYGDGGLCHTRRADLAEAIRQLRTYGLAAGGEAVREGVNSRLDEIQAAILQVKLRHLPAFLARRRHIARQYAQGLSAAIERPAASPCVEHSYHLFVVACDDRQRLIERLAEAGIGYGIHYPQPIHCMRAYAWLGYPAGSLPECERAAGRILSLPCFPELDDEAVARVAAVVNDAVG